MTTTGTVAEQDPVVTVTEQLDPTGPVAVTTPSATVTTAVLLELQVSCGAGA